MRTLVSGLWALTACILAACGTPDSSDAPANLPAPPQATGFMTDKTAAPPGAADTRKDGVMRDADGRPFSYAFLGEPLPLFKGSMADGTAFDSSSIKKWTVIDVWGIWCSDCVADAPYADALSRAIAQDPELAFLSVHVPASRTRATPEEMFGKYGSVANYMREKNYSYPVVIDSDGSLRDLLQIAWTPSYMLVSPDGVVRGFRTDLSVAEGDPVKDFMRDIARVRGEVKRSALTQTVAATIGPGGAMNLKGETPFKLTAIEAAFPGQTVTSETVVGGIENYPVFHISAGGERLYTVSPDWTKGLVAHVSTTSAGVAGPTGERVGATALSAWRAANPSACVREVPHSPQVARFICRKGSEPAEFIFAVPLSALKSGTINGLPNFAEDPVLSEMRYLAPAPATKN
jgi:thiol-disulfide isomerase/thioredoxin